MILDYGKVDKSPTPMEIFNSSPTGELFHVFDLFDRARAYFTGDRRSFQVVDGCLQTVWTISE